MEDTIFTDKFDTVEYFGEELAAILEEDIMTQNNTSLDKYSVSSTSNQIQPGTNFNASSSFLDAPQVNDSSIIHNMHVNSSAPYIPDFGNSSFQENQHQINLGNLENQENEQICQDSLMNLAEANKSSLTSKKSNRRIRPPSHASNHIISERKRRELLSQRFIALTAIVPGLKKIDKTSVLGEAIKYLKQLKERVKTLEEQSTKKTMELVVLVKKTELVVEDESSPNDQNGGTCDSGENSYILSLPEIEARMCEKSVLLRIHCEKSKAKLVDILEQVQKLNLSIRTTNVVQFGGLALDITIIAEMEKEFNLTMKELVSHLRLALQPVTEKA